MRAHAKLALARSAALSLAAPRRETIARWAALLVAVAGLLCPGLARAAVEPVFAGSVSDSTMLPTVDAAAVAGNYAYVTDYYAGRLSAIDISLPSSPFIAGSSASSGGLMNGSTVNVAGGYAFVASKNRNGPEGSEINDDGTGNSLTILDIHTTPVEPQIVGTVHDADSLFGAYGIAVSGNYAYTASQGCVVEQPCPSPSVGHAFDVIEIAGSQAPRVVATLRGGKEPQAYGHITSVAISGHYAYLTAAYQDRLTVIDIANPLSPKLVASLHDEVNLSFPVDVAIEDNYAYVISQKGKGPLTAVDISNPAEPKVVGSLSSAALNGGYRIRTRGAMAYVSASANQGIAVVDISDPSNPRLLASYVDPLHLHSTTGLDLDENGEHVVATSTYLPGQKKATFPPYPLEPGGPEQDGTVSVITLDPAPIKATIEAGPASSTSQTSASFAFSVNDAVATVRCRLDGGPWTLCTSPTGQSYADLSPGPHEFQVQATDSADNTSTPSHTWTITESPESSTPPAAGGGSGGSVPGSGSGSPGSGVGAESVIGKLEAIPGSAEIRAALANALIPRGKAGRIASVDKHRGYQAIFDAPAGGELAISWYEQPRGAHRAGTKPVLVASGRASVTAKGSLKLAIKLTARGRSLLGRGHKVKLTGQGSFTLPGRPPVAVVKSFTLR
jgi:hypothetical protein